MFDICTDALLKLQYKSLNVPLPLKFNKSTIKSLDATYDTIDGHVTTTLKELRTDIDKIHETTETTIMQILTYVIGTFTLLNSITLLGILLHLTRKLPRPKQLNIRSSDKIDLHDCCVECQAPLADDTENSPAEV